VRIEDSSGAEEVFTHAQKDEDLLTENDKDQEVRGFEDLLVKKDRKRTVEGNQTLAVTLDDVGVVEGNQTLLVQKNRDTDTVGNHDEAVEGNQAMTVGKNLTASILQGAMENVGAAKATTIGGGYSVNVALAMNEAVGGLKSSEVGGAHFEYVLGSRQETVAKDSTAKVGSTFQTEVTGQLTLTMGKDWKTDAGAKSQLGVKEGTAWLAKAFELKADTFNLIVNDKLILKVEKSGNITWAPKVMTLDGSEVKFKGAKVKMEPAGSMVDKSVKPDDIESLVAGKPGPMEFSVKSKDGKPMADRAFEVTLPDGTVTKGKTGADGNVKMEKVPAGQYKVTFPDEPTP
jgi:type VI secretion system secreted protein VgrG